MAATMTQSIEQAKDPGAAIRQFGEWDRDTVDLIKKTVAKGATDDELRLFLYQAKRTGLDPLTRQIHFVKRRRKNKETGQWEEYGVIQAGIDGLRVIAERSGKYAGQVGPLWCGEDGVWIDVWLHRESPSAAKVGVLRKDFKEPMWVTARYGEYVPVYDGKVSSPMWEKMPAFMIAKTAEALALRKAFPQDLSGVYSHEEMDAQDAEFKVGGGAETSSAPPTIQTPVGAPMSPAAPENLRGAHPVGLASGGADARYQATPFAIVTQLPEPAAGVAREQGRIKTADVTAQTVPTSHAEVGSSPAGGGEANKTPDMGQIRQPAVPTLNAMAWGQLEKNRNTLFIPLPHAVEAAKIIFRKPYNGRLTAEQMVSLDRTFALYAGKEKVGTRVFESLAAAAEFVRMEIEEAPFVLAQEKEDASR